MSREVMLCLMGAEVMSVLSSPDSKPPAWAFVGDDASLTAYVRDAPDHLTLRLGRMLARDSWRIGDP